MNFIQRNSVISLALRTWFWRTREGNGRLSRLLLDVLSVLAGKGVLDYSLWDEHKIFYFKAVQAGVSGNYCPMMQLVSDILPD